MKYKLSTQKLKSSSRSLVASPRSVVKTHLVAKTRLVVKTCLVVGPVLAVLTLLFFKTPSLLAQTTNDNFALSVSPPVSYLYVKPGEKLRHSLIVKNNGNQPLQISVNVTDFKPDGKTGQPVLQPGKIFNREANPDLAFDEPFTLPPNRSHSINLQFDVAEVVQDKEYPLAILISAYNADAQANSGQDTNSSQARVAGTVVSNLIVYIGKEETNQGRLEIAELNLPKFVDSFEGIMFEILARNTGKTATLIQGKTVIENIFKQTINEYIFYPDFVLANSTRMVRGVELTSDILDAEGLLDPEKVNNLNTQFLYKPPFMIGMYRLHFQLGQQRLNQTVVALPFSLLIAVGVGFLMYWGYKKIKSRFSG